MARKTTFIVGACLGLPIQSIALLSFIGESGYIFRTSVRFFGRDPDTIMTPYSKEQIDWLQQRQDE